MNRTIATTLLLVLLGTNLFATEPKELQTARERFQRSPHPSEADRQRYIISLAGLRDRFAEARKTADWQAVDAEIRRHPAPKNSDSNALSKILVGEWASPRHEYLFRANGTWTMLPETIDGFKSTHGRWRIEGNQFFELSQYTIILLTQHHFIFTDSEVVFYEARIEKGAQKRGSRRRGRAEEGVGL